MLFIEVNRPAEHALLSCIIFGATFSEGRFHQLQTFCFSLQLLLTSEGVFCAESGMRLKQIWVLRSLLFHWIMVGKVFESSLTSSSDYYKKAHTTAKLIFFLDLSNVIAYINYHHINCLQLCWGHLQPKNHISIFVSQHCWRFDYIGTDILS